MCSYCNKIFNLLTIIPCHSLPIDFHGRSGREERFIKRFLFAVSFSFIMRVMFLLVNLFVLFIMFINFKMNIKILEYSDRLLVMMMVIMNIRIGVIWNVSIGVIWIVQCR